MVRNNFQVWVYDREEDKTFLFLKFPFILANFSFYILMIS